MSFVYATMFGAYGKNRLDNISDVFGKFAESIGKMMDKSNEQVEKIVGGIVDGVKKIEEDQHNSVWEELTRLEIPVDDCVDVLNFVAEKPRTNNVFKYLSDTHTHTHTQKKNVVEFVMSLLRKK